MLSKHATYTELHIILEIHLWIILFYWNLYLHLLHFFLFLFSVMFAMTEKVLFNFSIRAVYSNSQKVFLHYLFNKKSCKSNTLHLLPSKVRRHTNAVFFNLVTPSRITTCRISKSPQGWSLIVRSSPNYFPLHQAAITNSMLLLSTYTPYLQYFSSWWANWNPVKHLWWCFLAEIVNVLRLQKSSTADAWQNSWYSAQ